MKHIILHADDDTLHPPHRNARVHGQCGCSPASFSLTWEEESVALRHRKRKQVKQELRCFLSQITRNSQFYYEDKALCTCLTSENSVDDNYTVLPEEPVLLRDPVNA